MKILVVHGEGLGNIIQILPLLSLLDRQIGPTDLALAKTSFGVTKGLFPGRRVYLPGDSIPEEEYTGKICTIWGSIHGELVAPNLPVLNNIAKQQMRLDTSEVSVYLGAGLEQGITREHIEYNCSTLIGHRPSLEHFDVVISDGYNWKRGNLWKAKSYPRYSEVAGALKKEGLNVCSVGANQEYIPGTDNRTGLGLEGTLGLIKNCEVVISNDSGFYHCASAMRKPTVVVFTFTSVIKNWDYGFHKTATVVRKGVPCYPRCHGRQIWKGCKTQECRDIDPFVITAEALKKIRGR